MGNTVNLGLPYPANTDPVANAAAAIQALAEAIDSASGAAWTAYVPAWTSAGATNPTIGNGSIVGRYRKVGKTVQFRVVVTCGSTTTYGTAGSQYSLSLPVAAHATGRQIVANGDAAIGSAFSVRGRIEAAASTVQLWTPGAVAGGGDRTVTPAVPAAFATGAVLVLEGTYEAA